MMWRNTLSRKRTFKKFLLLATALLISTLYSCEKEKTGMAYIDGKIINPKGDFVIITNHDDLTDTIKLNEAGVFKTSFDSPKSGIYSIAYPGEYQSFYMTAGDSLGMRANTKAFDETLAFTGSHSKENNFLIKLFSEVEKSNMQLLKFKNNSPSAFYKNVTKVRKDRSKKLERAAAKHEFDPVFVEFADFIIRLNSYYELERYSILHDGNPYKDPSIKFPDNFFAHRKNLNVNQTSLLNNYAYRPYVNALVSNIAFRNLSNTQNSDKISLSGYVYNKERLKVIDSVFTNNLLKNQFAANEIRNFVRGRKDAEEINKLVADFLEVSTDDKVKEEVAQMAATYIDLDPGNKLPNFKLRDSENETVDLSRRIKHLSVLYYWSVTDKNYAMGIHDQVKDLQLKYPEIEFIGINIDKLSYDKWQDAIADNDFRNSREFQIDDMSIVNRQLALRNSNRSMVVDRDLTIIDPNINLFYYKIETTLLGYINR